jgi:uncharacterized protein
MSRSIVSRYPKSDRGDRVERLRRQTVVLAACISALCTGCTTHADRAFLVRDRFFQGDLTGARTTVAELLAKPDRDQDALELDQAMIELCAGRPKESERLLRGVRDRFDHLEQKDAVEVAKAMLTDDNRLAYAGEDHEKILIRAFLALSNLMSDGQDAEAYSLQIAAKQQDLIQQAGGFEEHPELENMQVALGPYVRAMIHEETSTAAEEVVRNRTMVVNWQPEFRDGKVDLARAQQSASCQPGNGVVYVFGLVGKGPRKEEVAEVPTQAAMFIADRIISAVAKYDVTPTLAPIRVPVVVRSHNRIDHLQVAVDDQPQGDTATLVDVGQLAESHFEAKKAEILGRAVARRTLKKGLLYGVKDAADAQPGLSLLLNVVGVAWEAVENSDTRCWGLLPDRIQVLRMELPAGKHSITLTPADHASKFGYPAVTDVEVQDGRNLYVMANFPESHLVGEVLVSGRDAAAVDSGVTTADGADLPPDGSGPDFQIPTGR